MVSVHLFALLIGGLLVPGAEALDGSLSQGFPPAAPETLDSRGRAQLADSGSVAVLVHEPGIPDQLDPAGIRRIFLLRQRFWPDGSVVAPVNLPADSPIRESFSRLVLGQSTRDLAEYWKDLYFHGTQPPPVLDSEEAVVLYVSRTPGGIGYVSQRFLDRFPPPSGVRVVGSWPPGGSTE